MHQPPNAFGLAIWFHFTHGGTFWSFFPSHRKYEHILLDFIKIDLGIHANAIQYIGIASSTDLIKTNLPALESHLLHQLLILDSSFASSQFQSSLLESLQKMRISSTNSRCVMLVFVEILSPSNNPLPFASRIALLNPSATRRKSKGDSGQPYLRPLSAWKKGEADPFIRTAKEAIVMHSKIHFMKGYLKPRCVSRSLR